MTRNAHLRFGVGFLGLAVIQLALMAILGYHLFNLLAAVDWLAFAAAHLGVAIRRSRRNRARV
jgi:hypothetical protein